MTDRALPIDNATMATAADQVRRPHLGRMDQVLAQDRDPHRAEARSNPEGMIPVVSAESGRLTSQEAPPDLRRDCPICGQPYRSGDKVMALACFAFATSMSRPAPGDGNKIMLGHHACVLPRLLTLLAGFQPEIRFVKAASESIVPELYHERP